MISSSFETLTIMAYLGKSCFTEFRIPSLGLEGKKQSHLWSRTMECDVVNVEAIEHLRLRVQFRDGLSGEVVFRENHLTGVFEPLKDSKFFAHVTCGNGYVEWPGEIDLAPDAMHEAVRESGVWVLA